MPIRCGIDLGTTYSSISWYDAYNNRVQTIDLDSADGANIIRSVVYYQGGGQPPVAGEAAFNARRQHPDRVIVGIKRAMGTDYKTPASIGGEYTAAQVSAEILKTIARDAETFLGEEVKEVVITVPAYFGDNERAATEEAGKLAGLNVIQLLSEPQAAALAFAVDKVASIEGKALLVYDLGGGTFDVTLVRAGRAPDAGSAIQLKVDTLLKEGNASLGGLDWDRALVQLVAEKATNLYGVDVLQDAGNEAMLFDNCEKAKRHLSRAASVSIVADSAGHQVDVSQSEFEDRTRDLVLQTQAQLEKVLHDAEEHVLDEQERRLDEFERGRITKQRVEVLLAGGSTKMPMVRRMIEGVLERPPLQHRNPELLVTIGAAYWAHLTAEGATVKVFPAPDPQDPDATPDPVPMRGSITDVSAFAVGVEVIRPDGKGGAMRVNSVIIPPNSAYEQEFKKEFRTSGDGMTEIPLVLYQGDSTDIGECKPLMDFTISGLPPDRPKGQLVEVTLKFDSSGIIRGTGLDVGTKQKVEIVVDRSRIAA